MMQNNSNRCGTAAVLSFVFSGLGQLYNGQIAKGLCIIFLSSLSLLSVVLGAVLIYVWVKELVLLKFLWWGVGLFVTGVIFIGVIGVYSIVDAYKKAGAKWS
jgi:TM2 domain-containing membrane protein YozV